MEAQMVDIGEDDGSDYLEPLSHATQYHRRAEQFVSEGRRHSLIFNLASVALECYLVALCKLHGIEPLNHNFICLMNSVESVMDFPKGLSKDIQSLDIIFGICSLDDYFHGTPEPKDAERVLSMCTEVKKMFG
ncbi:HEPN domain-containing protein [Gorillibacterium timonense]|uniref:HEPN domain-containing protein n=1 Tax=Gorillibacterium timonense TaxID=1689269 RepID=UPI001F437AAA|nr:HEPN domain-containing protein [Gorillibacterium timonense]